MNTSALLKKLKALEIELHKNESRRNRKRMEALLHPEFIEFGRSGRTWSRAEIIEEFGSASVLSPVESRNFDLVLLAEDVALLTYVSAHVDEDGIPQRQTLRSSLWVRTGVGWQMRFHQGTPTTAATFDRK
jgi:hypothetical protein